MPARLPRLTGAGLAVALLLSGCGPQLPPRQTPTPTVEVMTVRPRAVPNLIEVPGRIEAVRTAEVRARVDGVVERLLYQEGSDVAAGAPLFQIDPRDRRAQVDQARAALTQAEASRANAAAVIRRYDALVARGAVSAQDHDAAQAARLQAEAGVAQARAALDRAELALSYTTVRAPISGRVGRALVTEGALVSAAQATPMTVIHQLAPVHAVFSETSTALSDALGRSRSGASPASTLDDIRVTLILETGAPYPAAGRLDFADRTVDPATGGQTLRAVFTNADQQLLPGQFVRGRIAIGTLANAIVVPARAVQIRGDQATVMVVGADGATAVRPVTLGRQQTGGDWLIEAGLQAGDPLIIDGWQKARPGQKVQVRAAHPTPAPQPR